jgi:hypothetical protein
MNLKLNRIYSNITMSKYKLVYKREDAMIGWTLGKVYCTDTGGFLIDNQGSSRLLASTYNQAGDSFIRLDFNYYYEQLEKELL